MCVIIFFVRRWNKLVEVGGDEEGKPRGTEVLRTCQAGHAEWQRMSKGSHDVSVQSGVAREDGRQV